MNIFQKGAERMCIHTIKVLPQEAHDPELCTQRATTLREVQYREVQRA